MGDAMSDCLCRLQPTRPTMLADGLTAAERTAGADHATYLERLAAAASRGPVPRPSRRRERRLPGQRGGASQSASSVSVGNSRSAWPPSKGASPFRLIQAVGSPRARAGTMSWKYPWPT